MEFSDLDGYTAEADANKLLVGLGIPIESHEKKMSSMEPGLKLRVLLAQALFGNPDILRINLVLLLIINVKKIGSDVSKCVII